jgi:hypothetical protein
MYFWNYGWSLFPSRMLLLYPYPFSYRRFVLPSNPKSLHTLSLKKTNPTVTKDNKRIQSTTKVLLNHITGMGR